MQCDDGTWRSRLPESDIGDDATTTEDADAVLSPASEGPHAVDDVGAAADLQDMATKCIWAFLGDDYGWLGLVLGARWPATGSAATAAAFDSLLAYGLLLGVAAVFVFVALVGSVVVVGVAAATVGVVLAIHEFLLLY